MSFSNIGIALKNAMLLVKNTDLRVGEVYNYEPKVENGINFPAIVIVPIDWDENYFDSCKNDVSFNFAVRVLDEIVEDNEDIEANLRSLSDVVIDRLKEIDTITWTWWQTYKLEYTYEWGYAETQNPLRVFQVFCRFKALDHK